MEYKQLVQRTMPNMNPSSALQQCDVTTGTLLSRLMSISYMMHLLVIALKAITLNLVHVYVASLALA